MARELHHLREAAHRSAVALLDEAILGLAHLYAARLRVERILRPGGRDDADRRARTASREAEVRRQLVADLDALAEDPTTPHVAEIRDMRGRIVAGLESGDEIHAWGIVLAVRAERGLEAAEAAATMSEAPT